MNTVMMALCQRALLYCTLNSFCLRWCAVQIRVPIPKASQETRENMGKVASKAAEKAKVTSLSLHTNYHLYLRDSLIRMQAVKYVVLLKAGVVIDTVFV
jgi:hypothetical protein